MDRLTEAPEALAAGKLGLAFLAPALGIAVKAHRRSPIGQIHDAAWIQGLGRRWDHVQVLEQALMNAAGLQPRHLGGPHIEHIGAAAEGAGAATALVVGFQQLHL